MRKLSHEITLDYFGKYTISNEVSSFSDLPTKENFSAPALRIKSEPFPKGYEKCDQIVNFDDYIDTFFDNDTDPELKDNYLRAIHGELEGWKLFAFHIERNRIKLEVGKSEDNYKVFEIAGAPLISFSVEAPTVDGKMAKYYITAYMEDPRSYKAYTQITVAECGEGLDRRDLVFQHKILQDALSTEKQRIDVTVIEYR